MAIVPPAVNPATQAMTQQTAKPEAAPKAGQSKFDQVMANKASGVQQAQQVNSPDSVRQAQQVTKTAESGKLQGMKVDWARAQKGVDPVQAKSQSSKAPCAGPFPGPSQRLDRDRQPAC